MSRGGITRIWDSIVTLAKTYSITHFLWADNIFLVSDTPTGLQTMIDDATQSLFANGILWKASSLRFLVAGDGKPEDHGFACRPPRGEIVPLVRASNMKVSGEMLDDRDSTSSAAAYRLQCAE